MLSLLEMSVAGAVMILAVMAVRFYCCQMASQGDAAPAVDGSAVQASYAAACALSNSIYAAAERFGRMTGKPGLLLGRPGSIQAAAAILGFLLLSSYGRRELYC